MKAILEFELPEDQADFDLSCHGLNWALVAHNMDNELRRLIKYEGRDDLQTIRDMLHELMDDQGVNLNSVE